MPEEFFAQFHRVPDLDAASQRHCTSPNAQGRNCEHNYDDCLPNPCPAAYSCVDGINAVSCLPPATDAVPPATAAVKNITQDAAVPALALNTTSTGGKYSGVFPASEAGWRIDRRHVLECSRCRVRLVSPPLEKKLPRL